MLEELSIVLRVALVFLGNLHRHIVRVGTSAVMSELHVKAFLMGTDAPVLANVGGSLQFVVALFVRAGLGDLLVPIECL